MGKMGGLPNFLHLFGLGLALAELESDPCPVFRPLLLLLLLLRKNKLTAARLVMTRKETRHFVNNSHELGVVGVCRL